MELSTAALHHFGGLVRGFIVRYLDELEDLSVSPGGLSLKGVRKRVSEPLPQEGQGLERVWEDFQDRVVDRSVRVGHSHFLAWIRASPLGGAVFAEALASALNQSVAVWDGAPAATEVERQVIDWLIEMSGYHPEGGGILTLGGSMANFSGLLAARSSLLPEVRKRGVGQGGPFGIYLTSQTHYSVHKGVEMMGLGRDALREIPVGRDLKMDPTALKVYIQKDRSGGVRPMAVIATLGATSTGTCDDLGKISRVCEQENVWLHVDGAYGSFAGLVPGKRHVLDGIERADSFVLDPHKNLFMPFEAGCLLVRDLAHLRDAFGVVTDYLPNTEVGLWESDRRHHFRDFGPQLSRNFRALKIYLTLKLYGVSAIADEIEREYHLATELAGVVRRAGDFELLAEPELGVVAFRYVAQDISGQEALNAFQTHMVDVLQARGNVFLSRVSVQGKVGFRACFVSHRTRGFHLSGILGELRKVADVVLREGENH